jgi:hypothetical protein
VAALSLPSQGALIDRHIAERRDEGAADATIDRETELLRRALTLGQEDGLIAYVPGVTNLVKTRANPRQRLVERARVSLRTEKSEAFRWRRP